MMATLVIFEGWLMLGAFFMVMGSFWGSFCVEAPPTLLGHTGVCGLHASTVGQRVRADFMTLVIVCQI